ncbi:hypothetical protein [Nodularia sp. NIES-3585]|uniref:hypothetical protein n=1 Tax=Nodularia sp. NIES-3585 TaxID=1973477 RepID=UPI0011327299|nr:hypothetical protein [Nodularia sp. NIES-3585]
MENTNQIIAQIIITSGSVISIYVANRFLESFKKNQEQKKVTRIIIASMENHLHNLEEILKYLNEVLTKSQMNKIYNQVNQIKNNYIYESALKQVGILTSKHIDIISKSYIALISLLDQMPRLYDKQREEQDEQSKTYVSLGYDKQRERKNEQSKTYVRLSIEELIINTKLDIMLLSREILQDDEKFNAYKKIVQNLYSQMKVHIDKRYIFNEHGDRINSDHYESLTMNITLERIEKLFEEYSLLTELNDSYNKNQIEFEKKENMDFDMDNLG